MRTGRCLMTVCTALIVPAVGFGQPPTPKPGPEHELLKKLEGTWDASVKSEGKESKGTMTYKAGPGGLWMVADYQGDFGGAKFEGRGLDGYDPMKKKYVSVWVDSMSTSPLILEGTYDTDSKTMTMTGEGPGMEGKPVKWKSVNQWKDDDTIVFTMYMVQDGKDQEMMRIDYKRKK